MGDEGYEDDEGDEGDEGGCVGDDRGRSHGEDRGVRGSQTEGREGRACCIDCRRNCRGEEDGEFVIPQVCMLKLKHKPARKAGKKMMFGKEVKVAAKPATKVVKAFAAKALKDSI